MKKPVRFLFFLCPACLLVAVGCEATRAGYESAPYEVVRSDGRFELREYPDLVVAETAMEGAGQNGDGSFGRLFRFISGGNEEESKIAMTTPVFMTGSGEGRTMAFVMPAALAEAGPPEPSDENVEIRKATAGTFATLRFRGSRNSTRESKALEELKVWLAEEGLVSTGSQVYAYFDPPWTPSFLRRNEVMLRVTTE